jgi:hypothetical protein
MVDRHHHRREPRAEIFVELPALAGMAIGGRQPGAVALDRQARRLLGGIDAEVDEIGKFVGEPPRLVFLDARQLLRAGIKPQPGVEHVSLLDRLDDRGACAFEFHGFGSRAKTPTISATGKFLMKAGMASETPLTLAFDAA